MFINKNRIDREKITVSHMIKLYCKHHHKGKDLCDSCSHLHDYAMKRLENCPYEDDKPTCAECPIHCYRKKEKEEIRKIMRYSGPRMIFYHPIMAVFHLIDEKKKK